MRRTTSQGVRQLLSLLPSNPISGTPSISQPCLRTFSNSANTAAAAADKPTSSVSLLDPSSPPKNSLSSPLLDMFNVNARKRSEKSALQSYSPNDASLLNYNEDNDASSYASLIASDKRQEPHHFHIYATKHNTHITLTTPERNPLISVACGNIGFRKSGRKHYDSAFQLAGYVMKQMQERGLNVQIKRLEVVLRGFGAGREAVTKALLGAEGRNLRDKVVKVSDSTRLKFGGTRGKKPRRLG